MPQRMSIPRPRYANPSYCRSVIPIFLKKVEYLQGLTNVFRFAEKNPNPVPPELSSEVKPPIIKKKKPKLPQKAAKSMSTRFQSRFDIT